MGPNLAGFPHTRAIDAPLVCQPLPTSGQKIFSIPESRYRRNALLGPFLFHLHVAGGGWSSVFPLVNYLVPHLKKTRGASVNFSKCLHDRRSTGMPITLRRPLLTCAIRCYYHAFHVPGNKHREDTEYWLLIGSIMISPDRI